MTEPRTNGARDDALDTALDNAHLTAREAALSRSAALRAAASERFFWWRMAALLSLFTALGWVGVNRVQQRSAGIRTAHDLARVHDELREQVEINRRLEARLIGKKRPVELEREGRERHQMKNPEPGDHLEGR